MKELQTMILRNEDLQLRWKSIIKAVCDVCEAVKRASKTLLECFESISKTLSEYFEDVWKQMRDLYELSEEICSGYPQSYAHPVNTSIKVNTKGFSKSVVPCARSRC